MARTSTYIRCPTCARRYSGPNNESHLDNCPYPLEKVVAELRRRLVVNTCPHCANKVYINSQDLHECSGCHRQWTPSWTRGISAVKASTVEFTVQGLPESVTELPERGSGAFTRLSALKARETELEEARQKFAAHKRDSQLTSGSP